MRNVRSNLDDEQKEISNEDDKKIMWNVRSNLDEEQRKIYKEDYKNAEWINLKNLYKKAQHMCATCVWSLNTKQMY